MEPTEQVARSFIRRGNALSVHLSAVIAWCTLASGMVAADIHYVDVRSRHPKTPYLTKESAARTIHKAIEVAQNGDTVLVHDGIYKIDATLTVNKSLTLRSINGPAKTIVDAQGQCRVFRLSSGKGSVTLEGLTITGGRSAVGGGIQAGGKNPLLIENCIVENCSVENSEGLAWGGGIQVSASAKMPVATTISRCIIRNNQSGHTGGGIHAVMWEGAKGSITIENCLVYNNRSLGASGGVGSGGGGIGNHSRDNHEGIKVINCTITDNRAKYTGGGTLRVDVYNSIVVGNRASQNHDVGEGCKLFNSCSSRSGSKNAGNIRENPGFVSADEGDFRLVPNSPCIDTGSSRYVSEQSTDLDGNPRMADGNRDGTAVVDMGAYEFAVIQVEIDINPGLDGRSINLEAGGLLPVGVLTTDTFSVAAVDLSSVQLSGLAPAQRLYQDVDGDGDVDLLLYFKRSRLKWPVGQACVVLTGETLDGQLFSGMADIRVIAPKRR